MLAFANQGIPTVEGVLGPRRAKKIAARKADARDGLDGRHNPRRARYPVLSRVEILRIVQ
jgi:hypothetical protein